MRRPGRPDALTGTWPLARLALRADRVRLPVWVAAITLIVTATAASFGTLYTDIASRLDLARSVATNPALLALYGRLEAPTSIGGLTVWRQGAIQLVLVALLNLLTVVRHTRTAEETGRLELVGAAAVGRGAPLAAALGVAAVADLALTVLLTVGMVATGEELAGSFAFAAGVGVTGLAFAGVGAVTAQVTENSRVASGIAGAVLATAFLLRAVGDASLGGSTSWLSWTSPLGWAQQVRPYADERWWALVLGLGLFVVAVFVAQVLQSRRDFGAGLVPQRPGPARAGRTLATPLGLAWRLQRSSVGWWTLGLAVMGGVMGSIAEAIEDLVTSTPQVADIIERLGGSGRLVDAFFAAIMSVFAVIVSAQAVMATLRMHAEETSGRAEPVLATSVTRTRWAASHVTIALLAPVLALAATGASTGLVRGLITGSPGREAARMLGAALAQLPAVWVLVGITVLVIGLLPRLTSLAWGALTTFLLLGQVGPALKLDQWLLDLSPYVHVPPVPGPALDWTPLWWLMAVATAALAVGLAGLARRDIG